MKKLIAVPILASLSASLVFSGFVAMAECSRDDIDHYLAKGFSTEQITALCDGIDGAGQKDASENGAKKFKSAVDGPIPNSSDDNAVYYTPINHQKLLMETINGHDITLNSEELSYTKKECVENDDMDYITELNSKICFDVRYGVARKGLVLKGMSKDFWLFGDAVVNLEGTVTRDVKMDLSKYNSVVKDRVRRMIGWSSQLSVPIHSGSPEGRVLQAFKELIRPEKED